MLWEMAIERKKRRKWSLPAGVDGEMGDMRERERERERSKNGRFFVREKT